MIRLLTIGDGNFSFSSCLAKILMREISNNDYTLHATSFDSLNELSIKYPESISIINELHSFEFVKVLHSVDATNLVKCLPEQSIFDCIIFNFPHLGTENCLQHSAFIAHIFDRYYYANIFKRTIYSSHVSLKRMFYCIALV